uniref:WGS project CAEQ00000000 data, annotated contig 1991 n=1 Tax=Trypanosoma congolense (strain IL3000) TaxID=1068625 RepID=F9WAM0_TRYCI|nr:unnamed protein product [Trypanosoma congolense IL3000]
MRCAISSSDAPKATLRALYDIFKCIEDPTVEVGNDDKRNIRADDVERVVLGCLEEYWPPYANMVLPPIAEGFARRRLLTERAYRMARDHVTGFLTVKEAACYVGVTPVAGRENVYQCQRCADGLLERTAPEYVLKCGRCHYNAEFDVLARNETHHACTVYQLSVVCGLLNSFSYSQSFKKSFIPSECRGALHALKQLRGVSEAGASHQFISRVIGIGVDLLLSGLPETTLGLLRVQCGAPDVAALRDIFTNDSNYLWTTMLRIHVRQTVTEWLKSNTVSSGGMHIVTMPEALIVMAFQSLVKNFKGDSGYAKDVLRASKSDSPDSNVALLLFICESVVRMTYVERLLARPLTRAALDVFMVDYATPSENSNKSMSACTTDGVLDHCSGVKSEVVEPKSVASDEDDGRSLSPETAAPVSSFNRGRKRQRSPLPPYPRSAADSVVQSDSSFSPFYSDDESVEMSASAIRAESIAFETIDEGDVKMVRSAYFWASHCEVYGIGNMEEHTVEIEEDGVKSVVQPPPASFWAREVHGATHDGMLLTNVINDFVEKLLALSATVRAVK